MWSFMDPFRGKITFSESDIHYGVGQHRQALSSSPESTSSSIEENPNEIKVNTAGFVLMSLQQAKHTLRCVFDDDILVTAHTFNDKNKSSERAFEKAKEKFNKGYRSDGLGYSLVNYCLWKKRIAVRTHSSRADEAAKMAAECYKTCSR